MYRRINSPSMATVSFISKMRPGDLNSKRMGNGTYSYQSQDESEEGRRDADKILDLPHELNA